MYAETVTESTQDVKLNDTEESGLESKNDLFRFSLRYEAQKMIEEHGLFGSTLFKRIDLILQDSQWTHDTPLALSNKIYKVLEEAKKEFPNCKTCERISDLPPCNLVLSTSDIVEPRICPKLTEWAKKWLGVER